MRLRVREREGETQGNVGGGGLGFVGIDSSLSTNSCKPISKSVNQTHCLLLHIEIVQSVCVREREKVCVCVLPVLDSNLERVRLFVRTKTRSSRFFIELGLRSE